MDEQGGDLNHEIFPLIMRVREVLRANGVPLRPQAALCGSGAACGDEAAGAAAPAAGRAAAARETRPGQVLDAPPAGG